MIVYTDSIEYAETVITPAEQWRPLRIPEIESGLQAPAARLFPEDALHRSSADISGCWNHAFLVRESPTSQYDIMIEMSRRDRLFPDGVLCLAKAGRDFHGQRGRAWSTVTGNIHMTACFSPRRRIDQFHIGFSLLAAVSVIESIDSFEALSGRAKIKWINDVLIDGAKVAGFLASTSGVGNEVSTAVLGIGLNVEATPRIDRDAVIPQAACLSDFVPERAACKQKRVLHQLLRELDKNYNLLLSGHGDRLLDTYRERSAVIGRRVRIVSDAPDGQEIETVSGTVTGIGGNLELLLEGVTEPVTRGRLIFAD